ncbi:MFS transporter [Mangrovihabitans endophyticus]|uniref:MFS transporter n=1 Tax=Mangrovihabitans endophyticus TaxID=1751298 RepID=UPI00166891AB|nr:MFS transporter [Mangrovihabitans endophyticus]
MANANSLVLVVLVAGVLDAADRWRTLLRLQIALALPLTVVVLLFGLPARGANVYIGAACYLAVHGIQAMFLATMETTGADLAPPSWPSTRTAALLTSIPQQLGSSLAPTVAGALIARGTVRGVGVIALGVVAIAAVMLAVFARPARAKAPSAGTPVSPAPSHRRGGWASLRRVLPDALTAARFAWERQELVYIIIVGSLANLVIYPFYAMLPVYVGDYRLSAQGQAVLLGTAATAYSLGMLAATLWLLGRRIFADVRTALAVASAAFGTTCMLLIAATLAPYPWLLIGVMALAGALFAVLISVAGGTWLELTPAAMRVRVFSLRRLVTFWSIPVGTAAMGFGGAHWGYRVFSRTLIFCCLAALIACWLVFRSRFAVPSRNRTVATDGESR